VNEVPVSGEAGQQVPHALHQSVHLRMDQHLCHKVLGGILYQPLTCGDTTVMVLITSLIQQLTDSSKLRLVSVTSCT